MPYTIRTKDGIEIKNIPDDILPESQELKDRVAQLRTEIPTEEPVVTIAPPAPGQVSPEAPEEEPSIGEVLTGVGETALTLATGATGGLLGQIIGTVKGIGESIARGEYGTDPGAQHMKKEAEDLAATLTYIPKTEEGREYVQKVAEVLAPLEALTPLSVEATAVMKAAKAIKPPPIKTIVRGISPAARALQKAEKLDIPVMTTDVKTPKTFVTKWLRSTSEKIPLAGTGVLRKTQQAKRIDAVRNVLREFGADDAAQAVDDVMIDLSRKRAADLTKYSGLKKDVFKRLTEKGKVPVKNTLKAVDDQIDDLAKLKTKEVQPVIAKLEDFKAAISDQNINNVEQLRKVLGESFKSDDLSATRSINEKAISGIYGAVREDIGNFIKANGEPKDFNKWKVANSKLSEMAGELRSGTLKSVLKRGDATPEAVRSMLFSKKPSEIKTLYKGLTQDGRKNARIAILNEAVQKSGGIEEISPRKFLTQIKKLENQTGVFFKGEEKQVIDGLATALSITRRADEFAVSPPTGAQLTIPVGAAVLTDILGGAGAGLATAGTIGFMTRVYESAPIRNALIKLGNLKNLKPGSVAGDAAIGELMTAILSIQEQEKENVD